jgi:2-dehydro-3-deoxygalactonokinase
VRIGYSRPIGGGREEALSYSPPQLISVDWGTSSLRAYLADADGAALAEIAADKGALSLQQGEHEPYLASLLRDWKTRHPHLPVVASGMVGARQGWIEAPYASCPAGLAEIAAATVIAPSASLGGVRIVPGVSARDARGAPDVMRGEETQILGALAAERRGEGIFVLPGTHSKWARVESSRIIGFETYMTGEAFAALKDHTVLGRMMAPPTDPTDPTGFALGVDAAAALERPGDLLHAAFMTRTFGLFGQLPPDQLAEYLSGLFVGAEILAGARGARAATVIGAPALVERYRRAGALLGVELTPAPANCATLGQIAVLKGAAGAAE